MEDFINWWFTYCFSHAFLFIWILWMLFASNYKCNTPSFWLIKLLESSSDWFSNRSRTSSSWSSFSISSDAGFVCCDCCEPLDTWLLRENEPRLGAANVRWFAGFTVIINLALFATIISVTCFTKTNKLIQMNSKNQFLGNLICKSTKYWYLIEWFACHFDSIYFKHFIINSQKSSTFGQATGYQTRYEYAWLFFQTIGCHTERCTIPIRNLF